MFMYSVQCTYTVFSFCICNFIDGCQTTEEWCSICKKYACNMHAMCVKFTSNIKYCTKKENVNFARSPSKLFGGIIKHFQSNF